MVMMIEGYFLSYMKRGGSSLKAAHQVAYYGYSQFFMKN